MYVTSTSGDALTAEAMLLNGASKTRPCILDLSLEESTKSATPAATLKTKVRPDYVNKSSMYL